MIATETEGRDMKYKQFRHLFNNTINTTPIESKAFKNLTHFLNKIPDDLKFQIFSLFKSVRKILLG